MPNAAYMFHAPTQETAVEAHAEAMEAHESATEIHAEAM